MATGPLELQPHSKIYRISDHFLKPKICGPMAAKGNTSWVCDPSLGSYALELPEILRSLKKWILLKNNI